VYLIIMHNCIHLSLHDHVFLGKRALNPTKPPSSRTTTTTIHHHSIVLNYASFSSGAQGDHESLRAG
jgi:hypothetical protein